MANRGVNTEQLLEDLRLKAEYYSIMLSPAAAREAGRCSKEENRIFSFFKKKRQEQLRPVLLSLIHMNRVGKISDKLYNKALEFIYNFYVCYNIIGEENSNKITNVVYKFAEKIENDYCDEVLTEFISELKKKMPSKAVFINAFKNVGWSHHSSFYEGDKNKDRVQTVLEVWERHINEGECSEEFTIEHILDDYESSDNGQIGNLIPLELRQNGNLSGKSYDEKIAVYEDSQYKTARKFAKRYSGKVFKPTDRTEFLAEKFYDEVLSIF